ncbi:ATPase domain protein [Trypanosoma grayi]|uniref:ATPase domain protein n=1 Tax=Trypanosoma grayi TaxID=71804 RepID=UPI0004F41484|nr:ATPase domain protein [Trypanosoma grayi]KEG14353.1 ATPase domain protein [Trypanosoma grayi]
MSVDGVILSDLRRVLSEVQPVPFFFLLLGPAGSGKSTNLQAVREGAAAYGMRVVNGMPTVDEADTGTTGPENERARMFVVDFNALRSFNACAVPASATYPPGTVVLLDDIWAIDYLLRIHALLDRLETVVRRLLRSPHCVLVTSATDVHHVPQWLLTIRAPMTYQLRELTPSAVRRYLRCLPDADAFMACAADEGCTAFASCINTRRSLMLYLCHARLMSSALKPAKSAAASQFIDRAALTTTAAASQGFASSDRLFGLHDVLERVHTLVRLFMERDNMGGCGLLAAVASTTGILLHGPSGSGKTALAMQLAASYPDRFFFVSCATLFSKYLGESEERLRVAFMQARQRTPSVLVLDDVDVIGASRGALSEGGGSESLDVTRRMLAALLCELDGLLDNTQVLVIATTSVPDILDGALLRQGRFETLLYVPPLSFEAAQDMALDFFARFDCEMTESAIAAQERLSFLVASRAEGSPAASLKAFLRELLERQLESVEATDAGGEGTLCLPTEGLVKAGLEGTTLLKRVNYAFHTF